MTPPKKTGPFAYFACDGKLDASTLANSEPALRTLACWTGWAVILQLQYDRPYTNSSHHSNGKVSSTLGVSDDTGVVKEALIYDPAPCLHHTPRITPGLPRLFWHGVELSWKVSCTRNGPVLDEIRRILVHPKNNHTGVANMQTTGLIYDSGVASTLFMTPIAVSPTRYLRHRGTFAAHTPDRPGAATAI